MVKTILLLIFIGSVLSALDYTKFCHTHNDTILMVLNPTNSIDGIIVNNGDMLFSSDQGNIYELHNGTAHIADSIGIHGVLQMAPIFTYLDSLPCERYIPSLISETLITFYPGVTCVGGNTVPSSTVTFDKTMSESPNGIDKFIIKFIENDITFIPIDIVWANGAKYTDIIWVSYEFAVQTGGDDTVWGFFFAKAYFGSQTVIINGGVFAPGMGAQSGTIVQNLGDRNQLFPLCEEISSSSVDLADILLIAQNPNSDFNYFFGPRPQSLNRANIDGGVAFGNTTLPSGYVIWNITGNQYLGANNPTYVAAKSSRDTIYRNMYKFPCNHYLTESSPSDRIIIYPGVTCSAVPYQVFDYGITFDALGNSSAVFIVLTYEMDLQVNLAFNLTGEAQGAGIFMMSYVSYWGGGSVITLSLAGNFFATYIAPSYVSIILDGTLNVDYLKLIRDANLTISRSFEQLDVYCGEGSCYLQNITEDTSSSVQVQNCTTWNNCTCHDYNNCTCIELGTCTCYDFNTCTCTDFGNCTITPPLAESTVSIIAVFSVVGAVIVMIIAIPITMMGITFLSTLTNPIQPYQGLQRR